MNYHLRFLLTAFLIFSSQLSFAQNLLKNEEIMFTFLTADSTRVTLAKDISDAYLVFRFGTGDKTELEFPAVKKDSWRHFSYSFYFRGGGEQNEGLDLNYLSFSTGNFKYVIYDTYSAAEDHIRIGIKIINNKSGKTTNLIGDVGTKTGSLVDFRYNDLVGTSDELFD